MSPQRAMMIGAVLVAAVMLPACNKSTTTDTKSGGDKSKTYDSPQAAFDAATAAATKEDWGTFMSCLTDDSQDKFTFGVAFGAMFVKGFAGMDKEKGKDVAKAIVDAIAKHGVTEAHLDQLANDRANKKLAPPEERDLVRKLVQPINDKAGFVADMLAAMKKAGNKQSTEAMGGDLKDVKVEGDKAAGTVVRKKGGKDTQEPIEFRKVDGGWKIELPDKPLGGLGPK